MAELRAQELIGALQDFDPKSLHAMCIALRNVTSMRPPDVVISRDSVGTPYMKRWWLIPRRKYGFNAYLHHFLRSDDDRAVHDHPWANMSYLIEGEYIEHVPRDPEADPAGETIAIHRKAGDFAFRDPSWSHRIELFPDNDKYMIGSSGRKKIEGLLKPVWTLFLTGPDVREWGFWCPKGWKPWKEFTGQDDSNGPVRDARQFGRGCGED